MWIDRMLQEIGKAKHGRLAKGKALQLLLAITWVRSEEVWRVVREQAKRVGIDDDAASSLPSMSNKDKVDEKLENFVCLKKPQGRPRKYEYYVRLNGYTPYINNPVEAAIWARLIGRIPLETPFVPEQIEKEEEAKKAYYWQKVNDGVDKRNLQLEEIWKKEDEQKKRFDYLHRALKLEIVSCRTLPRDRQPFAKDVFIRLCALGGNPRRLLSMNTKTLYTALEKLSADDPSVVAEKPIGASLDPKFSVLVPLPELNLVTSDTPVVHAPKTEFTEPW